MFPRAQAGKKSMRPRLPLVLLTLVLCATAALAAEPGPIGEGGVMKMDLKKQLETGLLARRPIEFDYINQIVKLVEEGQLPRKMVVSTFLWARRTPTRKLEYFAFALQARAKNLKVQLPDLRKLAVGVNVNGGEHGVTR
jgi:hypothetical protein